jgi:glycine hydroxymethyltransferase
MKEPEMELIAGYIDRALMHRTDEKELHNISSEIKSLCSRFPLYPELT